MTTYKSKIGLSIIIPFSTGLLGTNILLAYEKVWIVFIFILLVTFFIVHMFLTTYYQIDRNILRVKCGFFINKSVDINKIVRITGSNNSTNSPALSFDRLEIFYNNERIMISPKNKDDLLSEIRRINPAIEMRLKG